MANTSFFPPILNDNIQIPQKIIHADQTETITSISDFTSLLDGPGRYFIETSSTSRPTLLSIGLIPVNTYGVLEAIRLDEGEYNYYLNYRGENNKRWFATMIMGICSTWQEVAIKSDLDALSGNITNIVSGTVTVPSATGSIRNPTFYKVGRLCILKGTVIITGTLAGTSGTVLTVPNGFKPTTNIEVRQYGTYANTAGIYTFQFNSNGTLYTNTGSSTFSGAITIDIVYFT